MTNNAYLFYFVSWCESLITNYNHNLLYKITTLSFRPTECHLIIFFIIKMIYAFLSHLLWSLKWLVLVNWPCPALVSSSHSPLWFINNNILETYCTVLQKAYCGQVCPWKRPEGKNKQTKPTISNPNRTICAIWWGVPDVSISPGWELPQSTIVYAVLQCRADNTTQSKPSHSNRHHTL